MAILTISELLDKLPQAELEKQTQAFLQPLTNRLPDKRLQRVAQLGVKTIVAARSPIITKMAQTVLRTEAGPRAAAMRLYRFVHNKRVGSKAMFEGLYELAQKTVEREQPAYLVIAIDPVNFEKPYTQDLEGVCTVHKATPPDRLGKPRLALGYPAITACLVNTRVPAVTYANWFSYKLDFLSQNKELEQAVTNTQKLFPRHKRRFVADSGLDDQKIFGWFNQKPNDEFVIRLHHLEREVEVYNERERRWEREKLKELAENVLWQTSWQVSFQHAGEERKAKVAVGWYKCRLVDTKQELRVLIAEEVEGELEGRRLVLGTNVALLSGSVARTVYSDWRLRSRIEHGYRFDQEAGLNVEAMLVRNLEAMRVLFGLVLAAAQLVYYLMAEWPAVVVEWVRELGGAGGQKCDRGGVYLFLQGLVALYQTFLTISFVVFKPFPYQAFAKG
jgi:hypothetical protein